MPTSRRSLSSSRWLRLPRRMQMTQARAGRRSASGGCRSSRIPEGSGVGLGLGPGPGTAVALGCGRALVEVGVDRLLEEPGELLDHGVVALEEAHLEVSNAIVDGLDG